MMTTSRSLAHPQRSQTALRRRKDSSWRRVAVAFAAVAGGGLVIASGAIHLHLWAAGYRHVPTIGTLFLLQGVAGVVLGALIALSRRLVPISAGAAFLAATIGGLLLSATVGVFGFHDHLDAPLAGTSLVVEAAGVAVLALAAGIQLRARR
jgi:hypothetical protein